MVVVGVGVAVAVVVGVAVAVAVAVGVVVAVVVAVEVGVVVMNGQLPGMEPVTVTASPGEVTITVRNVEEWRRLNYGQHPFSDASKALAEARHIAWPD